MTEKTGILVVGHGTRSILGVAEFTQVVFRLRNRFSQYPLAFGFLELAQPNIDSAVEVLKSQGVTSILTAPLLLFAAGHAKSDIPAEVLSAASKRGLLIAGQAEVLGVHPRLAELSLRRFQENCETNAPQPAFVLAGRGSRDLEAQTATNDFVAACRQVGDLTQASHGFLAMANPSLTQVLSELGSQGKPDVVVVPHLLFHGDLIEKCRQVVAGMAGQYPGTRWMLARRLGPDDAVVWAAGDRIQAELDRIFPRK